MNSSLSLQSLPEGKGKEKANQAHEEKPDVALDSCKGKELVKEADDVKPDIAEDTGKGKGKAKEADEVILDVTIDSYKCALYRVQSSLRDGSDKHYEPVMVSIGPYHHGNPALKDMEKHKIHCMEVLLERVKEYSSYRYVKALKNKKGEIEALHCYRDTHQMDVDSFGECMVRDGFFLIELFRGTWRQGRRTDMLFNRRWMMPLLERDLLLYENEIPLFVLCALFALTDQKHNEYDLVEECVASTEEGNDSDSKFVEQALGFFNFNEKPVPNLNLHPRQLDDIPHLLGLVYEALVVGIIRIDWEPKQQNGWWKSFLGFSMINIWSPFVRIMKAFWSPCVRVMRALCSPFVRVLKAIVPKTPERPNNSPKSWEPIWTAVALGQVGVQFRPADDSEAFYDIRFSDGVLSNPPLRVNDGTETFFRNLVAYEQFRKKYFIRQQVGDYLMVMDSLINSAKDVELLRHYGIIDNGLGDDEKLSTVFNQLSSGLMYVRSKFLYAEMYNEVNKFCKNPWNKRMAKLKNEYFGSPWSVISFVAALLLLLLTAFQTGYSAASYYYQPKSQG